MGAEFQSKPHPRRPRDSGADKEQTHMTHKERMITALTLGVPDRVPTMELEFQLSPELLGKAFLTEEDLKNKSPKEIDLLLHENAALHLEVYSRLEHDAFGVHYLNEEHTAKTLRYLKQMGGEDFLVFVHGDGTFALPDGEEMVSFAYRMYDEPEALLQEADVLCRRAIERNRRLREAGADAFILCSDYCFNMGPFLSPAKFRELITPFLTRIIQDIRRMDAYAIKHTDGDIMPILDQLVQANPHAIHSLDPMADVDIRRVKELVGDRVALCGNVNCALMQTGTEEEVVQSAQYCLRYGKPGGGYVYCTSNVPFRGLPLERYLLVLDVWKKHRDY